MWQPPPQLKVSWVEYAKAEPQEIRGRTQAMLQIVFCAGSISSVFLAAFGFNGRKFTGSFNQHDQLSYRQFLLIFAVISGVVGIAGFFFVREGPASRASIRAYCRSSWRIFESKAFCSFALYILANTAVFSIFTSAGTWVGLEWAQTKDMQRELSNFLGMILAIVGSWLTQKYLLNVSWRKTVFASITLPIVIDMAPQFLTIFDIVRNQYFYLGEPITSYVPEAMADLIYLFMVNEFADGGKHCSCFRRGGDCQSCGAAHVRHVLERNLLVLHTRSVFECKLHTGHAGLSLDSGFVILVVLHHQGSWHRDAYVAAIAERRRAAAKDRMV